MKFKDAMNFARKIPDPLDMRAIAEGPRDAPCCDSQYCQPVHTAQLYEKYFEGLAIGE